MTDDEDDVVFESRRFSNDVDDDDDDAILPIKLYRREKKRRGLTPISKRPLLTF